MKHLLLLTVVATVIGSPSGVLAQAKPSPRFLLKPIPPQQRPSNSAGSVMATFDTTGRLFGYATPYASRTSTCPMPVLAVDSASDRGMPVVRADSVTLARMPVARAWCINPLARTKKPR